MQMVRECCSCHAILGEKSAEGSGHTETSTICNPCVEKLYPEVYSRFLILQNGARYEH